MRNFLPLACSLPLLLTAAAALPSAATPAPAITPPAQETAFSHCMNLQGSLNRQASMLTELRASTETLATQRELERMRQESRIQALQAENTRLLYAATIAILLLLLAASAGFVLVLRKRQQALRQLSEIDALTGLDNRRAATAALDAMARQPGPDGSRHVVFLIDVDHFKQINDQHGHHVGDEVLKAMAARLKAACRPTDLVARWGGEEFLVACRDLTREQAEQVAARLRRAMAYPLQTAHATRTVTVSLGLAPIPFFDTASEHSPASRWDYALRMADRALYAAKRSRDAWVGYWGAQLPDDATAEAVLEQPEAAADLITVMSSLPRLVSVQSARERSLSAIRAQG